MTRRPRTLALVAALVLVWTSSALADDSDPNPLRRLTFEEAQETEGIFDAYDPMEGMNRRTYVFNARFDQYLYLPAVRGWEFVIPKLARTGVWNLVKTLRDATTFANSVLQLKPRRAASTLGRIGVNLTAGVLGLWDAATHFGMPRYIEDFGQTLGRYRVPAGPFLVVPVLGPSSARDFPGDLIDRIPFLLLRFPPGWAVPIEALSTRENTAFRYGDLGPPFEYDVVRTLFLAQREILVAD